MSYSTRKRRIVSDIMQMVPNWRYIHVPLSKVKVTR